MASGASASYRKAKGKASPHARAKLRLILDGIDHGIIIDHSERASEQSVTGLALPHVHNMPPTPVTTVTSGNPRIVVEKVPWMTD